MMTTTKPTYNNHSFSKENFSLATAQEYVVCLHIFFVTAGERVFKKDPLEQKEEENKVRDEFVAERIFLCPFSARVLVSAQFQMMLLIFIYTGNAFDDLCLHLMSSHPSDVINV